MGDIKSVLDENDAEALEFINVIESNYQKYKSSSKQINDGYKKITSVIEEEIKAISGIHGYSHATIGLIETIEAELAYSLNRNGLSENNIKIEKDFDQSETNVNFNKQIAARSIRTLISHSIHLPTRKNL